MPHTERDRQIRTRKSTPLSSYDASDFLFCYHDPPPLTDERHLFLPPLLEHC